MPIYEYECQACGTTFEKRQSFKEDPIADCPNGHPETRRLLSTPAIVFKGSGFYINDSKSSKESTNGSSSKNGKTESSSETKSKAKAEPKPETKSTSAEKVKT